MLSSTTFFLSILTLWPLQMTAPVAFVFSLPFWRRKTIILPLESGIFSEMKDNIIYLFHPSINPETSWENRFCSTLFFQDKVLIHIKRQSWKKGYWIFCSFFRTSSPSAAVLGFGNKNNFLSLVDSYTYPNLFIKATPLCVLSQICSCCRAVLHNSLVDYD